MQNTNMARGLNMEKGEYEVNSVLDFIIENQLHGDLKIAEDGLPEFEQYFDDWSLN